MSFSDFFSRFQRWRKEVSLVSAAQLQTAHADAQKKVELAKVMEGRLMLKQLVALQLEEAKLADRRDQLVQALQLLLEHKSFEHELMSGERIRFDLSEGLLWQKFCHELRDILKTLSFVTAAKRQPLLSFSHHTDQHSFQQLYDVRHLEQESDELLHYL